MMLNLNTYMKSKYFINYGNKKILLDNERQQQD